MQLRLAGASYDKIAAQLKLPIEEVERLVAEGVAALNSEPSALRARLELARLDALLMGIWAQAQRGDTAAVGQALKIIGQRSAILARLDGVQSGEPDNSGVPSVADQVATLKLSVAES
ncbi:hypothetical protein [Corynebacterium lujinxingii]|uniref:Uncharacterized protein n=1 Tax=Corynebacterium lujinxingii TaxID=2763010 RepID=A0A7H0JWN4_9CORY|nr:hypothetical protein [Corynebacterium lujinxingii]MBC3178136.1 hypothetical protein [Corynebacterium lujinxingii]NNO09625.1 hypothetical protein [Corynebacterium lujinxingii]QNP89450.1 hypothetical protein IAU68_06990 [Corynebacterium lujinxingii]